MWMRSALGQAWVGANSIGVPKVFSGPEAEKIVHHFAGYDDWRGPTINELMSIVDFGCDDQCIDKRIFPNHADSSYIANSSYISRSGFGIDYNSAGVEKKWAGFLRLVRSVSTSLLLEEKAKFHDNGDGTATDASTSLTWMRFTLGQMWNGGKGVGEPYSLTYEDAKSFRHTFAGFDDWRLPSIGELNSIVDREIESPHANSVIFNLMVVGRYLSSTLVKRTNQAYSINFGDGSIGSFGNVAGLVRLVRGEYQPSSFVSSKSHSSFDGKETKSYELRIHKSGSGSGDVLGGQDGEIFAQGRMVTLTARPDAGSVFDGWLGDVEGRDIALSFTVDSSKQVTAQFSKLKIPSLEVKVDFDGVRSATMRSGDEAFILTFSIANAGAKQIRVECPLATYTTCAGEEVEQDAWLTGLYNGAKGASIRSDAFRKMGLVFYKSKLKEVLAGDHLYISVAQTKSEQCFNFTFRCTDKKNNNFVLTNAAVEDSRVIGEIISTSPEMAMGIIQRIEALEAGLREALLKLEFLQVAPAMKSEDFGNEPVLVRPLQEVLIWLSTQDRVSVATLRSHLLPLDLLPSAVIDELNERALDLTGEIALEESGEEIMIAKEVLFAVIANLE